jgi:hypothetical protein
MLSGSVDVGTDRDRAVPRQPRGLFAGAGVDIGDSDPGALARELDRGGASDPGAASCDQRDLTLQPPHRRFLLGACTARYTEASRAIANASPVRRRSAPEY